VSQPKALQWNDLPNAPRPGASLCNLADVPDGGVRLLDLPPPERPEAGAPFRLLLLRSGASVFAYVNRCAHFGVPLAERQQQMIFTPNVSITCNVHYARYRWQDGSCLGGECSGEPLLRLPVAVDPAGGVVVVEG
jgi:nitrite reductase/ring-hydroxylating ferredoxin subunit